MSEKLGKLADDLYDIREKKGELQAKLQALDEQEGELQARLLLALQEHGIDQVRGTKATVSFSKSVVPQVKDWTALTMYVLRKKALHLLQRRLSVAAYREAVEANGGKPLPGCEDFEKVTINVRKV